MVALVLGLLPLALGAALSPVMLTEQTVILSGPGGRSRAWAYVCGTAVLLGAFVTAVVTVGQSSSLPQAPRLSASIDLVLGAALVGLAALLRVVSRRPRREREGRQRSGSSVRAFGFGAFSMASNVTSLALVVPAAKDIAASRQPDAVCAVVAVLLVVVVCLPAWAPVALSEVDPARAARVLKRVRTVIDDHGRTLVVALIGLAGCYLVVRGISRLLLAAG